MKYVAVSAAWLLLAFFPAFAQTQTASVAPAPTASATQQPSVPDLGSYRLGPGDHLHITVFGEQELTGDYVVAASGSVSFPLVGEVPAQGLTPEQLSQTIANGLNQGYLREARVATAVSAYRPFYILGEVQRPGTYPYAANLDAMSAIATAGGFTYRGSHRRVFIKREGESQEHEYRLDGSVPIRPGDTIRVAERFF